MLDWIHRRKYLSIVKWCRWIQCNNSNNRSCYYAKQIQSPFVIRYSFIAAVACLLFVVTVHACGPINRLHLFSYINVCALAWHLISFRSLETFILFLFVLAHLNESTDKPNTRIKMLVNQRLNEKQKQKITTKNLRNFMWLFENGM